MDKIKIKQPVILDGPNALICMKETHEKSFAYEVGPKLTDQAVNYWIILYIGGQTSNKSAQTVCLHLAKRDIRPGCSCI